MPAVVILLGLHAPDSHALTLRQAKRLLSHSSGSCAKRSNESAPDCPGPIKMVSSQHQLSVFDLMCVQSFCVFYRCSVGCYAVVHRGCMFYMRFVHIIDLHTYQCIHMHIIASCTYACIYAHAYYLYGPGPGPKRGELPGLDRARAGSGWSRDWHPWAWAREAQGSMKLFAASWFAPESTITWHPIGSNYLLLSWWVQKWRWDW